MVEELTSFGKIVSPTIGYRSAFVRAFSTGRSIADMPDGQIGQREIEALCDLMEKNLGDNESLTKA